MVTIDQCLLDLKSKYQVLDVIECDNYRPDSLDLLNAIKKNYKAQFDNNERIVFLISQDYYKNDYESGLMVCSLQRMLNDIDISNFFVMLLTTNSNAHTEYEWILKNLSLDRVPVNIFVCDGDYKKFSDQNFRPYNKYQKIEKIDSVSQLTSKEKSLLFESKSFCMLPWVSLMISSNSKVKPCCEYKESLGDCSSSSLESIWNSPPMTHVRKNMLLDEQIDGCQSCYVKEKLGRDSLRTTMNRKFFEHVNLVHETHTDGSLNTFNLRYLDARFNNLCNLSCRSCNFTSSSSWHEPAVFLGLKDKSSKPMLIAGKNQIDIYQQLIPHLDSLERIYFAGGEPLIIDQFYQLVEELDRRNRHNVELIYNTNMTKSALGNKSIFDLWKNFKKISVGGSLDGEYSKAEYLRSGCDWDSVVSFRKEMIRLRPDIDFFISATTTIVNALHLPDFHRSWVDQQLINPEDFDLHVAFDPDYLRVDRAPVDLKKLIKEKYTQHLEWLRPRDPLGRAVVGFQSILKYVESPAQFDASDFWKNINALDDFYQTNLLETFPELEILPKA